MSRRSLGGAALAAGLATSGLAVGAPAPASAYDGGTVDCQTIGVDDETTYSTTQPSQPLLEMGVDRAVAKLRQEKKKAGAGVVVAVVDSGVSPAAPVDVAGVVQAGVKQPQPVDYHGTAVAGLIAGKPRPDGGAVGIAPYAKVFDVRVYDNAAATPESEDESPITVENVRQGLDAVIAAAPDLGIRIVNLSLTLPDDAEVRAKVERLWEMGVVVVAPTGNRSAEELPAGVPPEFESHAAGEDAAPYVHPADYPHVLAVNATPRGADDADPTTYVLENSSTDVAAPTAGAVSWSLKGDSCVLATPATSYAAAEVSGVLALLQSAYDEPIAASVTRLLTTANGRPDVPNTLVGAGEVQALDAVTRPMVVAADGTDTSAGSVEQTPQVLSVPPEPDDVLASTRDRAVWWGLVGGGALLLALVLRPVLARRRRPAASRGLR